MRSPTARQAKLNRKYAASGGVRAVVERAVRAGVHKRLIAAEVGVTERTLQNWLKAWEQEEADDVEG